MYNLLNNIRRFKSPPGFLFLLRWFINKRYPVTRVLYWKSQNYYCLRTYSNVIIKPEVPCSLYSLTYHTVISRVFVLYITLQSFIHMTRLFLRRHILFSSTNQSSFSCQNGSSRWCPIVLVFDACLLDTRNIVSTIQRFIHIFCSNGPVDSENMITFEKSSSTNHRRSIHDDFILDFSEIIQKVVGKEIPKELVWLFYNIS